MSKRARRRAAAYQGVRRADTSLAQLAEEVRKLNTALAGQRQPIPSTITGAAAQAAQAQALYLQSQQSNTKPLNRAPTQMQALAQKLAGIDGTPPPKGNSGAAALLPPNTPGGVSPVQGVMEANMAPQASQVTMFAPGAPMVTVPDLEAPSGPRQYNYPVSYNYGSLPRSTEGTSVATLRQLALMYDGIQLCEAVWFDTIARLRPRVRLEENVLPDGESENDPKWAAIVEPAQRWLDKPDGQRPIQNWMIAATRDVLEIGYATIYEERDRAGRTLSLDIVDAATMKPLIDQRGKQPRPPFAAFQQFLYGVPAGTYRADEVTMIAESERTDSMYPFSRVERILLRVNQALRKQSLDMRRYSDGSVPAGFLFPDGDADTQWTPEQCELFEQQFNDLLAGNDKMRVRVKVGPPGGTFVKTDIEGPETDFDRFLLNITVADFGLSMDEIGMTETSNRSVGDSQENVVYRRVVSPVANRFELLFTALVKKNYDKRLRVDIAGLEEKEDALLKAQTLDIAVKGGWLSPSRAARAMGYPVDLEVPPFVLTKDGPIALEDWQELREAQLDAKLAGLRFAVTNPAGAVQPADAAAEDDEDGKGDGGDDTPPPAGTPAKKGPPTSPGKPGAAAKADAPAGTQDDGQGKDAPPPAKGSTPDKGATPAAKPAKGAASTKGSRNAGANANKGGASRASGAQRASDGMTDSATRARLQGEGAKDAAARHHRRSERQAHDLRLDVLDVFDSVARRAHHALA